MTPTPRSSVPRRSAATLLALVGPVATIIAYRAMRDRVPDPLPSHWNLRGEVDNTTGLTSLFTVTLIAGAVLAAVAILATWLGRTGYSGRTGAAFGVFGAAMAAGVCTVTLAASLDAPRAEEVALPGWAVLAMVVVAVLLGLAAGALVPVWWPQAAATAPGESALRLDVGENVVFFDEDHSTVARVIAALIVVAGVVAWVLVPEAAVQIIVFAVVIAAVVWTFSQLAVRIDARGVRTLWGPARWPRSRIPLESITAARVEHIEPAAWGGWGYRVSGKGVAAVMRRGPGLVISRSGRAPYAVTIPHADAAADVLNALLARQHAGS